MAHTRKQGGKELLWMLGIPTVIAAGIFFWFINNVDSQFTATSSYTTPTTALTTPNTVVPPADTTTAQTSKPAPKTTTAPTQTVAAPIEPAAPTLTLATTSTAPLPEPAAALTENTASISPPKTPPIEPTQAQPTAVTTPSLAPAPETATPALSAPEKAIATTDETEKETKAEVPAVITTENVTIETTEANTLSELASDVTNTETPTVEQGASGAAGPSDAPVTDTQYTTQTTAPQTVAAPPNPKPTDTGWIYIGQFRNGEWKSSGFDILDQMPKIGEQYNLTWGANIRARPPVKRTVAGESPQLAENVGYLAIGKQVEVLNVRRSGNKGHIWVEIPR